MLNYNLDNVIASVKKQTNLPSTRGKVETKAKRVKEDRNQAPSRSRVKMFAEAFKDILIKEWQASNLLPNYSMDETPLANFDIDTVMTDDGKAEAYITFKDNVFHSDKPLRRDSLKPRVYRDGVDNIVALLNSGFTQKRRKPIRGRWYTSRTAYPDGIGGVYATRKRKATGFIQSAVKRFNEEYEYRYGVTAIASLVYEYDGNVFDEPLASRDGLRIKL